MTKWEMLTDVTVWLSAIGGGVVASHLSSGFGIVVSVIAVSVGVAFGLAFGAVPVNAAGALRSSTRGPMGGRHAVASAPKCRENSAKD